MFENWKIRQAQIEEAPLLTELAMRSKAYWPYDSSFLNGVRPELEVRPEKFLPDFHVYILEVEEEIVGFCSLIPHGDGKIELEDLFIEPSHIGKGHGLKLWSYCVDLARALGFRTLVLTSDPNAESFYARRGAVKIGEKISPIFPDRRLPIMEYRICDI